MLQFSLISWPPLHEYPKKTLQFSLIFLTKSLSELVDSWPEVNNVMNCQHLRTCLLIKNDIVQCALSGVGYLAIPTRTWSKSDRKMTSITVTTTRNIAKMRQNLLPYCRSGNFLSTFKQSTPRKWNLKTAKSIRVVLFRKYAWKLVKKRPQSWLKADKFCFS